ncbi:unnamed protein product [Plutella xylostella]|uniref:(diamondback moth) hypothetical protein n=1 Tax=Plutella xylostella TaxID=51655 RepID=A0A8S4GD98_PLUXY|nr:unnamed protein product [Plutella xylostella]
MRASRTNSSFVAVLSVRVTRLSGEEGRGRGSAGRWSPVWDQIKRRSSCQILPVSDGCKKPPDLYREVNHLAFHSIRIVKCENVQHGMSPSQTIVTMSKLISKEVMQEIINFIYSGYIDNTAFKQEIRQASELLGFHEVTKVVHTILGKHHLIDKESMQAFHKPIPDRLREMYIERSLFADVTFDLDDGIQLGHKAVLMARCDPMRAMFQGHFRESTARVLLDDGIQLGHKAVLMARCDPMRAMFQGHFRESTARVISFPGVNMYTFHKLLCYMYTDSVPAIDAHKCVELLELANRLCMERLVTLVEARVIEDLKLRDREPDYVVELCLSLLEPVKLHNAHNLASWLTWHLCGAYSRVCRARALRDLSPLQRDYLSENRHPPVWYLKEKDYYQKCCNEQSKELKEIRPAPPPGQHTGCLCFSSKSRRSSGGEAAAALEPAPAQPPPL